MARPYQEYDPYGKGDHQTPSWSNQSSIGHGGLQANGVGMGNGDGSPRQDPSAIPPRGGQSLEEMFEGLLESGGAALDEVFERLDGLFGSSGDGRPTTGPGARMDGRTAQGEMFIDQAGVNVQGPGQTQRSEDHGGLASNGRGGVVDPLGDPASDDVPAGGKMRHATSDGTVSWAELPQDPNIKVTGIGEWVDASSPSDGAAAGSTSPHQDGDDAHGPLRARHTSRKDQERYEHNWYNLLACSTTTLFSLTCMGLGTVGVASSVIDLLFGHGEMAMTLILCIFTVIFSFGMFSTSVEDLATIYGIRRQGKNERFLPWMARVWRELAIKGSLVKKGIPFDEVKAMDVSKGVPDGLKGKTDPGKRTGSDKPAWASKSSWMTGMTKSDWMSFGDPYIKGIDKDETSESRDETVTEGVTDDEIVVPRLASKTADGITQSLGAWTNALCRVGMDSRTGDLIDRVADYWDMTMEAVGPDDGLDVAVAEVVEPVSALGDVVAMYVKMAGSSVLYSKEELDDAREMLLEAEGSMIDVFRSVARKSMDEARSRAESSLGYLKAKTHVDTVIREVNESAAKDSDAGSSATSEDPGSAGDGRPMASPGV